MQPVFRLPTAPVSGETPLHRLVASDRRVQELEQAVAATRQTINVLCDGGICTPQSLFDSASSISRDLEDARQSSSSQPGVSSSAKPAMPVQPGPSRPECDPAAAGPSRRRSFSPQGSLGHSSRQGSETPPRKRHRLSGDSSADEDGSSQLADNGKISRMTRTIFVLLRWLFCWTTSPASFQLPPNPWSSLPPSGFTSWRLRVW